MLRAGLTGGIASGKSMVAAMLRARGYPVLQLDTIGHTLLDHGNSTYDQVVSEFGPEIHNAGVIDRAKLGAIVFADAAKRERLNRILHPPILRLTEEWFTALERSGAEMAFAEAALLFEAGYRQHLDCMIVCWCRPEQQVERLQQRGLTIEQARQRIAAQMPVDEKRKFADETVDCSVSLEETQHQVGALVAKLKREAASRTAGSD